MDVCGTSLNDYSTMMSSVTEDKNYIVGQYSNRPNHGRNNGQGKERSQKNDRKVEAKQSSKRRVQKANQDILKAMIANEMASAWKEDDGSLEAHEEEDSHDAYGAQTFLAGKELDNSNNNRDSSHPRRRIVDSSFHEEEQQPILRSSLILTPGSASSRAIDIVKLKEDDKEGEDSSVPHMELSYCSSSSSSKKLQGQIDGPVVSPSPSQDEGDDDDSEEDEDELTLLSMPTSGISGASVGTRDTFGSGISLQSLTIQEIQDYVKLSLPEDVRKNIPDDAWGQIFNDFCPDKTRKPMPGFCIPEETGPDETSGEMTEVSEITEYTRDFLEVTKAVESEPLATKQREGNEPCAVRFSTVEVRYFPRIIDTNPSVTSGVAVSFDWDYQYKRELSIHKWELERIEALQKIGSCSGRARTSNDFVMSRKHRENLLLDLGYTKKDIATATRTILRSKQNRKVTVQNLPNQHMEEMVEKATRKVKTLLSLGRKKGLVSKTRY